MKMRPAWTCSSMGTRVLVADSLMEKEKSLGQDSRVTDIDIFLPLSRLSGSKIASHEHPSPWSTLFGAQCPREGPVQKLIPAVHSRQAEGTRACPRT